MEERARSGNGCATTCSGGSARNRRGSDRFSTSESERAAGRSRRSGLRTIATVCQGTDQSTMANSRGTVGAQLYSDVCCILLLVHDPCLPALGLDREVAVRRIDERVRGYVRRMCGVAVSHAQNQPATSITGMVIAMCMLTVLLDSSRDSLTCFLPRRRKIRSEGRARGATSDIGEIGSASDLALSQGARSATQALELITDPSPYRDSSTK